jgi:hypothetical protein
MIKRLAKRGWDPMEQHNRERRDTRSGQRPYARPTIREFGPVGQLTQSGTGLRAENPGVGTNQMVRQRP